MFCKEIKKPPTCSPWNSPGQSTIVEGFVETNSVFIVITLAKILSRWLFPSKTYIQFTIFNTYFSTKLSFTNQRYYLRVLKKCLYKFYKQILLARAREVSACATKSQIYYIFQQFIHPFSLCSCGNGTSFAFTSYITVSVKFDDIVFLNNFYFGSFFHHYHFGKKIRLVTLSKSYLYNFFFQSFLLVYWASFFHVCLYFWTQIKHLKLFLRHNVWREKRTYYIAYNNIWIWVK